MFMDQLLGEYRLDKSAIRVSGLADEAEDRSFWHAQSPEARLQALEFMRRVMYGNAATARLQRVLTIAELQAE